MLLRNRIRTQLAPNLRRSQFTCAVVATLLVSALISSPAAAKVLDFGAALQPLPAGTPVEEVVLDGGGFMRVHCSNHGEGPDLCIIFDSGDPIDDQEDLGTPNEDFGGPGEGRGGEEGEDGENAIALGKILVIAADDDEDDGLIEDPASEPDGGVVTLKFSHCGRLTLTLIDVDCREDEPRLYLFHEGDLVGRAEAEDLGDNSAQTLDLSEYGDIDKVRIHLDGTTGIGGILLDVPQVGVESATWTGIKSLFR